jgi:hypothetical protein
MERDLHAREELDQVSKFRVAAGVTPPADGNSVDLTGHHLEGGERLVRNLSETFPPLVIFAHAPAAVIAPYTIRRAVATPEGMGIFDMPEVTVLAESPAVDPRLSANINGELRHHLSIRAL